MWHDVDKLRSAAMGNVGLVEMPKKRWGHCCVAVAGKMFIIGGYQGN